MINEAQGILKIEEFLNQGKIFQAHNLASELLIDFADHFRIMQLNAISLVRLNQKEKALEIAIKLFAFGHQDAETAGLLGRIYKDLYKDTKSKKFLDQSIQSYLAGFEHSGEYYPAINAASLLVVDGQQSSGEELANQTIKIIGNPKDYWSCATLGEAYVLKRKYGEAQTYFKKAVEIDIKQFGKFQSTLSQLYFLQEYINIPESIISLFPKPNIAIFSGHMVDHPDRLNPRFPASIVFQVSEAIHKLVKAHSIDIAFTSAATGGDILFIEALEKQQAESHIFLPFKKDDFIQSSIAFAGESWMRRFETCLTRSEVKYLSHESYLDTPDLFEHLGKVMMGESLLLADQYGTKPKFLSLLSEDEKRLKGGTQDLLDLWPYPELHHNIDPSQFFKQASTQVTNHQTEKLDPKSKDERIVRRMSNILFADIVGFSKLLEEDTPKVILKLFSKINDILQPYRSDMEVINTWGDAIVICHKNASDLLAISSHILELFETSHLIAMEIPQEINIRIALHSGPIFLAQDPLTKEPNVYGSSINRTARMEPVTLPGNIYASDQFVALVRLENLQKYNFQHVGVIELPKGFGRQEVYSLNKSKVNLDSA